MSEPKKGYVESGKILVPFLSIDYVVSGETHFTVNAKPFCNVFYTCAGKERVLELKEDEIDSFMESYKDWLSV